MLVFTAMSGLGAVAATIAAIIIYRRQKRIALFEKRTEIWDTHEKFIRDYLSSWEWDGETIMISRFSPEQIEALFSKKLADLHVQLINVCEKRNELYGDRDYAMKHGDCHGRTAEEIETDLLEQWRKMVSILEDNSKVAYKKWLRL